MKITIRKSCFETNSSSSHSISVNSGELNDTIRLDGDGNIRLTGGTFGWGYESHNDALTKANYLAVDAAQCDDRTLLKKLKRIIKEFTGAKGVILNISHNHISENFSYIDHQSVGTGVNILRESDEKIRQFLFNRKSELIIDNDNH